jgi:DNA-binding Lrp family transcriptional regulator
MPRGGALAPNTTRFAKAGDAAQPRRIFLTGGASLWCDTVAAACGCSRVSGWCGTPAPMWSHSSVRSSSCPKWVQSHHLTGNYDYLLQVEVADLPAYEDFHANQLASLPGVAMVTSYVTMKTLSAG